LPEKIGTGRQTQNAEGVELPAPKQTPKIGSVSQRLMVKSSFNEFSTEADTYSDTVGAFLIRAQKT